jgi:hypothetical protein
MARMRAARSEAVAHALQERADLECAPTLKRQLLERAARHLHQSDRYLRLATRIETGGLG